MLGIHIEVHVTEGALNQSQCVRPSAICGKSINAKCFKVTFTASCGRCCRSGQFAPSAFQQNEAQERPVGICGINSKGVTQTESSAGKQVRKRRFEHAHITTHVHKHSTSMLMPRRNVIPGFTHLSTSTPATSLNRWSYCILRSSSLTCSKQEHTEQR